MIHPTPQAQVTEEQLGWKIHTPQLLEEILLNKGTEILRMPLQIFGSILHEVATRASELNDPALNLLMLRLTLYDAADPAKHSSEEIAAVYALQESALSAPPARQVEVEELIAALEPFAECAQYIPDGIAARHALWDDEHSLGEWALCLDVSDLRRAAQALARVRLVDGEKT